MKAPEIRALDEAQLDIQLTALHGEWRDLRFDEAVGKLTSTSRIRAVRRDIARIHTIRTERVLDAALQAGEPIRPKRRRRVTASWKG
jgi:large subunit ribosomal protein L29